MVEGGKGIPFAPPLTVNNRTLGRICPGRYLALRTIYLAIVCILSVFDIVPVLDEDGNPRIPEIEFDGGSVRYVFLESSIYTAAGIDRLVISHQGSQTIRMYYQASF